MARVRRHLGLLSCQAVFLLLSACAVTTDPAVVAAEPQIIRAPVSLDRNSYRLSSGDRIRIEVFGEPDLSVEVPVEASGTINYPLLGRVVVQGYTLRETEQLLIRRLADGFLISPSVRASMVQFRPFYVTGQVRRVGAYPFVEGLTVEKALALAGGMTEIASARKIYILREGIRTLRERASLDSPVFPGDTIVVDESLF
jgi:polysaccharide biosynthesis/export protein VpsN